MMKTISIIVAIITGLLLLSTLICGLWIKSQNLTENVESMKFHVNIGIITVVFGIAAVVLLVIQSAKHA